MSEHIGSSLDVLLDLDGTLEEAEAAAMKRVIVWQILRAMENSKINKSQLAEQMKTSRTTVNRLLDEKDTGVTIITLVKAGCALGIEWRLDSEEVGGSPCAA